ncbi:ABC transporter permease [Trujillonella humicola]|uniref:ABC transporter permease n=1 Tax=Trujillonella humicola TaxID=3383699 RepID=UPI0039068852
MTRGAGTTGGPRRESSASAGSTSPGETAATPAAHASPAELANPVVDVDLATRPEAAGPGEADEAPSRGRSFGLDRFSGLYVWAALFLVFAIWVPDTFLRLNTMTSVAGDQAITAMLALGIIIPLAAGVFDLSFAGVCGLAVAVTAWAQVEGFSPLVAALMAVVVATFIGCVNGFVVVGLKVNSFIATLGMSSLLLAATYWVTDGRQIVSGFSEGFLDLGTLQILGIPLPFYAMLLLAAVVYVVIEYLPVGRYLYAAGGNPVAARLAGVRVDRIVFGSLVASSLVAGLAGVVLAARLGTASPDIGPSYLLPAFSAVFLGSTQIKPGRVNVVGTLIAIYLLATGVKGLQLAGAPVYVNNLFNGAALIIAVALAARSARRA